MITRLSQALAVTTLVVAGACEDLLDPPRTPPYIPADKYAKSPLVGLWEEIARIPCDGGLEYEPFNPIRSLDIWASGSFYLTMTPVEAHYDYTAKFEADDTSSTLRMFSFVGIYNDDIDGEGSYEFDATTGQLVLHDVWLARDRVQDPNDRVPRACGHRFVPAGSAHGNFEASMLVKAMLDGRKDSSRRPRDDGSFETMHSCYQPTSESSYGHYLYSERSAVTKAGTLPQLRGDFIHIVDRGKEGREVLVTFYEPKHPEKWLGSCAPDVQSTPLAYPERGRERCALRLHREGDYVNKTQVWTGASEPGECTSDREGDAYMITAMRIDRSSVEIWERGFDKQGNQTWGTEAPTHFEPATAEWSAPVVDKPPSPTERLASLIAGPYSNAAQVNHRDFFPTAYTTCPVEITGHDLPNGAQSLLAMMSWPADFDQGHTQARQYLFTVYPQGEVFGLGFTPVRGFDGCDSLAAGAVAELPADKVEWEKGCTMYVARKDDTTYIGKTIAPCPGHLGATSYFEIDATIRDGAFDFWPHWYNGEGKQVVGPWKGPIEFRPEVSQ